MKKVFITGENGCIARYLDRILPKDEFEMVWSYSNHDQYLCSFPSTWNKGWELDICDYDILYNVIDKLKPDIIIHTAAYVDTVLCEKHPRETALSNVYGSYNVVQLCKQFGILPVFFSTTAIYDPSDYDGNIITSNTKPIPKTIYGITKYTGELICKSILHNEAIIIRPCFVYGGIEDGHSGIARLIKSSFTGITELMLLNPNYKKDYMRVEDLISAIVLLLKRGSGGEFNISRGDPKYFGDIIKTIETIVPNKLNYKLFPNDDYMKNHIVDNTLIKSLGWESKYDLATGVRMSFEEIRNLYNG